MSSHRHENPDVTCTCIFTNLFCNGMNDFKSIFMHCFCLCLLLDAVSDFFFVTPAIVVSTIIVIKHTPTEAQEIGQFISVINDS